MTLTQHFTIEELTHSQTADRLGLDNSPTVEVLANLKTLAQLLEQVRTLLGKPLHISSGYRCLKVNAAIGSKPTSQHVLGKAADFTCPGYGKPKDIMAAIVASDIEYDQCILEFASNGGGWVHISFSANPRKQALVIDANGTTTYS